ncbi:MAG: right-handed parallel beta-helix repeat-containing protein [Deltaproteobacteria bacterium]|nr:right-handed parallel beta-helix repeat-containing protein [Deltaproteobacteria bacterium]
MGWLLACALGCGRVGFDPVASAEGGADASPASAEICDSGDDDDGDGAVDCDDRDCVGFSSCPAWCEAISPGRCYYVDPNTGDDGNDGSFDQPWATYLNVVHWYDDGGSDPRTIPTELGPGDVVYLRAGQHDASYTLEGAGWAPLIIADGTVDAPIRIAGYPGEVAIMGSSGGPFRIQSSSHVVVEYLRLEAPTDDGLELASASNIELGNLVMVAPPTDVDSAALKTTGAADVVVRDSVFVADAPAGRDANAVIFYTSNRITFEDNEIRGSGTGTSSGLSAGGTSNLTLRRNWVHDLQKPAAKVGNGARVEGNWFERCRSVQIEGDDIDTVVIANNTFVSCRSFRLNLYEGGQLPSSLVFQSNLVVDDVPSSNDDATVTFGPYSGGEFVAPLQSGSILQFADNCYFGTDGPVGFNFYAAVGGALYDFEQWQGQGLDSGSSVVDPKLDDRLAATSSACNGRGAGTRPP